MCETVTHMSDTPIPSHREPSATSSRNVRTFRGGAYVARLMAELDRAAISLRIAEARKQRAGLTQPELAELLEPPVHWRTVQEWEAPNGTVPWDRLDQIGRITGVTKEWLLHGEAQVAAGVFEERLERIERVLEELVARLEPPAQTDQAEIDLDEKLSDLDEKVIWIADAWADWVTAGISQLVRATDAEGVPGFLEAAPGAPDWVRHPAGSRDERSP